MITAARTHFPWMATVVVGVVLAAVSMAFLRPSGSLKHDPNKLAIYGSAYGRLLARLSETTVDRVWHLGVEQIVPHNIDGSLHGEEPLASELETLPAGPSGKPILNQIKDWYTSRRIVKYARTNPLSLNETHLASVKTEIEEMLLRSFKMDPGHYGAYNSYHLFLTTHDLGGDARSKAHAITVANAALAAIASETEDPEPWLTAASAAMNLYLLDTESHMESGTKIPLNLLKEHQARIGSCLYQFEQLKAKADSNGNWDNLSPERQIEITHRYRFASRTFKQFDTLIARAENPDFTSNSDAKANEPSIEEE